MVERRNHNFPDAHSDPAQKTFRLNASEIGSRLLFKRSRRFDDICVHRIIGQSADYSESAWFANSESAKTDEQNLAEQDVAHDG